MACGLMSTKPKLYIHVKQATHFLRWEIPEFLKYFEIVEQPSADVAMLVFGPDVLMEATQMPALKRFAVLFPGFTFNPLYNISLRLEQKDIIEKFYTKVFINPGPLELAYKDIRNIEMYPFSIDVNLVNLKRYRVRLDSLLHVSSDSPQKDWQRSEEVMRLTGLRHEVFPPRHSHYYAKKIKHYDRLNKLRLLFGQAEKTYLPSGYVDHKEVIKKYQSYDGFVHSAKDIQDTTYIDGKYTASFIEAGLTGSILFWHDTFGLGNGLKTVFELPLDPSHAAEKIRDIRLSIDVEKQSKLTREEMMDTFNPKKSVDVRVQKILESI